MPSSLYTIVVLAAFSVYFVSSQDDCDETTSCNARGTCTTGADGDWYCICDDGYATNPKADTTDDNREYCNYEQKKQLTAFLLAWFLGAWGGGQWYLGLSGLAAGKLCTTLGVCCIIPCIGYCTMGAAAMTESQGLMGGAGLLGCCYCCCILGVFIWWLVDIIMFGMNNVDDSNGVSLEAW